MIDAALLRVEWRKLAIARKSGLAYFRFSISRLFLMLFPSLIENTDAREERGCRNRGHQMGNPLMRRAARANAHTLCTSHSSPEGRLWPDCLVVKSNHPCLERLCFEQFQLRPALDVLKERDSTT